MTELTPMVSEIRSMEIVAASELDPDALPFEYDGYGDLILSYLKIDNASSLFGIVDINDKEELWLLPEGFFKEIMSTDRAMLDNFAIGYLGFGEIKVGGALFKAVVEENASPKILYVSRDTRNAIMHILRRKQSDEH